MSCKLHGVAGARRERRSRRIPPALAILCAFLALAAGACIGTAPPLRVGANIWPGYEPLFLARSLGHYDGQPIELLDFSSATEVLRAYRNGLLDVAAVTLDEALLASSAQPSNRVVLVCDVSTGADALLAGPEIVSLSDLRGRRVAVEHTATGAYLLSRALERAGLTTNDVTLVPTPVLDHEAAFRSGRVDAVVTFEPPLSRLKAAGAAVLFDSTAIPGEIVDVLMTRRDLSARQEQALQALVTGWFQALAFIRANPADAARRIAPREGITPEQFTRSIEHLDFPDRTGNLRLLSGGEGSLAGTVRQLASVMRHGGFLPEGSPSPALDPSVVGSVTP